jgi:uncharacterized protein (DUF1330 family)
VTVYAIAQLSISDPQAYGRYKDRFAAVFSCFNGRLLAADSSPQVLEGKWERNKVVLLSFPDEKSFFEWERSPDYQEIAVDRKAGADAIVLLVRGLP